jgi:hypothetical protein
MQADNAHYIQRLVISRFYLMLFLQQQACFLSYFSIKIRNIRRNGSAAPHSN